MQETTQKKFSTWKALFRVVLVMSVMGLLFGVVTEAGKRTGAQTESAKQEAAKDSAGNDALGSPDSIREEGSSDVPECTSAAARAWLASLIQDNHSKLLDLWDVFEVIYDPVNDVRYCQCKVMLSAPIGVLTLFHTAEAPLAFRFFPKHDKSGYIGQMDEVGADLIDGWGHVHSGQPWHDQITEIQKRLARAANAQRIQSVLEEARAAMADCKTKRLSGELKTFVASANCSNPRIVEAFQRARYPYMELVGQLTAKRVEVSTRIDAGLITEEQGQLEITKFEAYLGDLEHGRKISVPGG